MNRRQKVIVSVVGIFIVLLALVGITYGYFLTRIQGNTNTTSISVTTADLKLEYGDGNNIVTASNIQPGNPINPKTFTVYNSGNAKTSYSIKVEDVTNTFTRKGDLVYTLKKGTEVISQGIVPSNESLISYKLEIEQGLLKILH